MTITARVEVIWGGDDFTENLAQADPLSWETSREVYAAWLGGEPIKEVTTANLMIYRLDKGKPILNLLERKGNLFLEDRFCQIVDDGMANDYFFRLNPDDSISGEMLNHVMAAIKRGKSVEVSYSDLKLIVQENSGNSGHVKIGDDNTLGEQKLISAIYGSNPPRGKIIELLTQQAVLRELTPSPGSVIARRCYIRNTEDFLCFGGEALDAYGQIRAIRRDV